MTNMWLLTIQSSLKWLPSWLEASHVKWGTRRGVLLLLLLMKDNNERITAILVVWVRVRVCYVLRYKYRRSVGHIVWLKSKKDGGIRSARQFRTSVGIDIYESHWEKETLILMEYYWINGVAQRWLQAYTTFLWDVPYSSHHQPSLNHALM